MSTFKYTLIQVNYSKVSADNRPPTASLLATIATSMPTRAEKLRAMACHGDLEGINKLISALRRRRKPDPKKQSTSRLASVVGAKDARSGNTALHFCCANRHSEAALALIEAGAPVNAVNVSGSSALHYAALTGQLDVVKRLVAAGADILLRNNFGNDPHDEATQFSHPDVASFLMTENEKQSKQREKEQKDQGQSATHTKDANIVNNNTESESHPTTSANTAETDNQSQ